MSVAPAPVTLGAGRLAIADVVSVARDGAKVVLDPAAARRVVKGRQTLEEMARGGQAIYGVTTGVGKLKDTVIPPEDRHQLQENLVLSHAAGVGAPLEPAEVRSVLLLLAASLARGHSGVRTFLIEHLIECLNRGVLPVIPERGSVGASGDLAPLAHVAACLIGHGEATVAGARLPAREALHRVGLVPLRLEMKEGLAILNGTHLMAGFGALIVDEAERLARLADVCGSMSLEALMGTNAAFDWRIHAIRPHPGQIAVAANLRALTHGSAIIDSHRDCARVQDAYSLRCMPQVHGAAREAIRFAREIVTREINSVTDNPLIFADDGLVLSAGNFHGQPLALALDTLAIGLSQLAGIAERRIDRLVNPLTQRGLAGLPLAPRRAALGVHDRAVRRRRARVGVQERLPSRQRGLDSDVRLAGGLQLDGRRRGAQGATDPASRAPGARHRAAGRRPGARSPRSARPR